MEGEESMGTSQDLERMVVIIPSLNPCGMLLDIIKDLKQEQFVHIILVDDGSTKESKEYFCMAQKLYGCQVLQHEWNQGKGTAIKTAMKYVLRDKTMKKLDIAGIVTVDGDCQHRALDVKKVCLKMLQKKDSIILGCRDFNDKRIPFRSRFGNKLTSKIFSFLCGIKLSDTQTGLRAIPYCFIRQMICVGGGRYEYETNVLLEIKRQGIAYAEEKIQTIYIENNQSSHFHPLLDSIRIYNIIFKFVLSSFSAFLIDISVFTLLLSLLSKIMVLENKTVLAATAGARMISSLSNYFMNKKIVFRGKQGMQTLFKYYLLCVIQMFLSYGIVTRAIEILSVSSAGRITAVKILADSILMLVSYQVQIRCIFY